MGFSGIPVVAKGDDAVIGRDLSQVDGLLGLQPGAHSGTLAAAESVERGLMLLAAALRLAQQLPPDRYDVALPGMEATGVQTLPDGSPVMLADGTALTHRRTHLGLVRHIVAHAVQLKFILQGVAEIYSVSNAKTTMLREPGETYDLPKLGEYAHATAEEIRRTWAESPPDTEAVVSTYYGPQAIRQLLHNTTYSLAQHSRQLVAVLGHMGIEPDEPLGDGAFEGLSLPEGVWS